MPERLSESALDAALAELSGWRREGEALARQYTFRSFPDAIAYATRLAFVAEANDHHPDLHISYRRVRVVWSTHSAGGITTLDVAGARQADALAADGGRAAS